MNNYDEVQCAELIKAIMKKAADDLDDAYFDSKQFEDHCMALRVVPDLIYHGYLRHKKRVAAAKGGK